MFVGIDVVHVSAFSDQLEIPGSRFLEVFHPAELRRASAKPRRAEHLAGLWAAKEAFIKAWSQSRYGQAPLIAADAVVWADIEVVPDAWGRVKLQLHGDLPDNLHPEISISHDGDYATAICLVSPTP
ncbi:holo-ACP synthase AcpS [Corynebacterium epidermidicanis]|uniref:Holo-[acyl-carrier-protein] synthase n=1 Tax=Corynebacterium epidermidicanis TaxID=1050174 RepID=A0A0G3GWC5_9CORY|nr:holo-ACP synthase [Corynebacterium epidermidicanis]AKK03828.1 phosphopantetheine--protein transferase [Corynebacterium epidermidicanis]